MPLLPDLTIRTRDARPSSAASHPAHPAHPTSTIQIEEHPGFQIDFDSQDLVDLEERQRQLNRDYISSIWKQVQPQIESVRQDAQQRQDQALAQAANYWSTTNLENIGRKWTNRILTLRQEQTDLKLEIRKWKRRAENLGWREGNEEMAANGPTESPLALWSRLETLEVENLRLKADNFTLKDRIDLLTDMNTGFVWPPPDEGGSQGQHPRRESTDQVFQGAANLLTLLHHNDSPPRPSGRVVSPNIPRSAEAHAPSRSQHETRSPASTNNGYSHSKSEPATQSSGASRALVPPPSASAMMTPISPKARSSDVPGDVVNVVPIARASTLIVQIEDPSRSTAEPPRSPFSSMSISSGPSPPVVITPMPIIEVPVEIIEDTQIVSSTESARDPTMSPTSMAHHTIRKHNQGLEMSSPQLRDRDETREAASRIVEGLKRPDGADATSNALANQKEGSDGRTQPTSTSVSKPKETVKGGGPTIEVAMQSAVDGGPKVRGSNESLKDVTDGTYRTRKRKSSDSSVELGRASADVGIQTDRDMADQKVASSHSPLTRSRPSGDNTASPSIGPRASHRPSSSVASGVAGASTRLRITPPEDGGASTSTDSSDETPSRMLRRPRSPEKDSQSKKPRRSRWADDDTGYLVEAILDEKIIQHTPPKPPTVKYWVKWVGFPSSAASWLLQSELADDPRGSELVADFLNRQEGGRRLRFSVPSLLKAL